MIIKRGHESILEHEKVTVIITTDRGVTHEIVRHRIASYSQESTRYCNYSMDVFGNEISVIEPYFYVGDEQKYLSWFRSCLNSEKEYIEQTNILKCKPEEARTVLPNSLKTEIVVTFNMREWRHFFKLRCAKTAHPQMRQVAIPLLLTFKKQIPILFDEIEYDEKFDPKYYANIIIEGE
jgi:thymidylate synthase (FAD)